MTVGGVKLAWINHRKIAKRLDMTTKTFRSRVDHGRYPLPVRDEESMWYYHSHVVEHFIKTGEWPPGLKYRGKAAPVELQAEEIPA